MLQRILTLGIIAGVAYWYYTGPWQDRTNPSDTQKLQALQKEFALCVRGKKYQAGATGESTGIPEETCASEMNLFLHEDGLWHSYDETLH